MDSKTKSTTKKKSESENILLERIERSNGGEDGVHSQSNNVGSSQKMKNSGGMGQDQPNDSVGIEIGTLDSTLHQKTENSAEQDTSEARNADIREDIPVDSVINLPTPCSEANTSTSTPTSEPGPFPSLFSQFRYIIANFSNRFSDIPRRSKILIRAMGDIEHHFVFFWKYVVIYIKIVLHNIQTRVLSIGNTDSAKLYDVFYTSNTAALFGILFPPCAAIYKPICGCPDANFGCNTERNRFHKGSQVQT
ncbi:hypothetical protein AX774_g176 [Zancudomyces culisetae]|uniref:Uncharacterized protein n=1 Tax=Zancudomyces culisetae TaxID=1213189 RepID=A0A1R1PZB2_ZANCU|nr:hypothetical protein AX774_g176 [Zancudomyces culisetae]|eukprot:OMH86284.1 hypothetical protein AX774_g176 [Zancudomyces culisetae]